ncbi:MAG: zf-HC2 domain-containing protein [Acidobacteria bacterium]|nr:zf-HC2 domain-containing protein [Acidobacteriota bacterium]
MSRSSPETCDSFAPEISAFVDGELPFPEALPAIDHLAACESCRRFYLETRGLGERVTGGASPAPEQLWDRVASRLGELPAQLPVRTSRGRVWAAGLAAAAAVVFALTLARRGADAPAGNANVAPGTTTAPSALREIVVEGARGRMTDERFVTLLSEILSADRKYHQETQRVMSLVNRREGLSDRDDRDLPRTEESEPAEGETGDSGDVLPKTPAKQS